MTKAADHSGSRNRTDLIFASLLVVIASAASANSLRGGFVHDDNWPIAQNYPIQEDDRLWQALTSDVWAFRSKGLSVGSNHWRPGFVLWNFLNYRLFGLQNAAGWHALNVTLDALTVVVAYGFLRFLRLSSFVAGALHSCLPFTLSTSNPSPGSRARRT